jgi:hypothetical protein
MLNCTVSCPSDMQSCRMWRWWEGPVGWGRILTGQKEDLKQGLCCGWSNESNESNLIIFDLISYIFLLLKSSESSDSRGSFSTSWGLSSSFRGRQKASRTPVSRKYATARVSIPWKVHNSVSNCTKLSNKGNRGTNGSFESYRCGDRADMGDSGRMYEHFQLSSIASWRPKALCQHSWPGKYNAARLSWHLLCFFYFYVAYGVACHLVACIIPKPPWSACWWQWQHCKERALQLQCAECQSLPGSSPQGHHVSVSVGKATDISYISYSLLLDFEKSRNTGRTQPLKKTCLHSKCDGMPWNARECHGNLATKWQLKKSNLSRQLLSTTEWGLLWLVAEAENIREEATETCESGAVPSKTKNATHGGNGANKTKNKTRI